MLAASSLAVSVQLDGGQGRPRWAAPAAALLLLICVPVVALKGDKRWLQLLASAGGGTLIALHSADQYLHLGLWKVLASAVTGQPVNDSVRASPCPSTAA